MNKLILFFALSILWATQILAQPKIIFDTDIGGDADDLGTLAMLHNYIDKGACNLLAIMIASQEEYAVSATNAINIFYKHPNIAIGRINSAAWTDGWMYNKPIADKFEHNITYKDVPTATELYRKILAKADDRSITIVTVGPLFNIKSLMQSEPDSISELNGMELLEQKVKEMVVMGGHFPKGKKEWNFFAEAPGLSKYVFDNLKVPCVFSGYELGTVIRTGEVFNSINKNTPLFVGFSHFCKFASWMQPYQGKIIDNASYDQTAVMYAIEGGVGKYWELISDGYCKVEENGDNEWVKGAKFNHSYLKPLKEAEEMATIIENLMLHK